MQPAGNRCAAQALVEQSFYVAFSDCQSDGYRAEVE